MTPTAAQFHEIEIPPGAVRTAWGEGDSFLVVQSNVKLEILRDGAPFLPYEQGDREDLPPGISFKRLEVKNPNLATAYVKIYSGYGRRNQNRPTVIEPPTIIKGQAFTSLAASPAAGSSVTLSGIPAAGQLRRKAVIISNQDAANPVYIKDADGNFCEAVEFKSTAIIHVSGAITIVNTTAAPIPVCVSEVWYTP
ncbi:MAG: hypothetical protein QM715_18645 [Nibricoccus sp.]